MSDYGQCNCEHAAHFVIGEWEHKHQPELLTVAPFIHQHLKAPACELTAHYVGPICRDCAYWHLSDFLTKQGPLNKNHDWL